MECQTQNKTQEKSKFDVSLIIVNYKTPQLCVDCIESILTHTSGLSYETIVVDNASEDGSASILSDRFPNIRVLHNEANVGFGRANNLGAQHSSGKYLFLLNSDTIILNNVILRLWEYMEQSQSLSVGAVGTVMLDRNGLPNHSNSYSQFMSLRTFLRQTFYPLFGIHVKPNKQISELNNKGYIDVDFIVGADIFCRHEVFESVGGFNPKFFMFYEEDDLQLQFKKHGYRRVIINGGGIIHLEGASTSNNISKVRRNMVTGSLLTYMRKNRPLIELYTTKSILITITIVSALVKFYKCDFKDKREFLNLISKG